MSYKVCKNTRNLIIINVLNASNLITHSYPIRIRKVLLSGFLSACPLVDVSGHDSGIVLEEIEIQGYRYSHKQFTIKIRLCEDLV